MFDHLYANLKRVLFRRWNSRLSGIVERGELVAASGMTPSEAYQEGYQTAYFDAVSDLIREGFVREPQLKQRNRAPSSLLQEAH